VLAGLAEELLGFTHDDDGRASSTEGDAEAGGEAYLGDFPLRGVEAGRAAADPEGLAEDFDAEAFSEHGGVNGAAAGEDEEELVGSGAAEDVVGAQDAADAAGDFAQELIAGITAEPIIAEAEAVEVDAHESEGALLTLDAVGFTEEHGGEGVAVERAGDGIALDFEEAGFAQLFELAEEGMTALDEAEMRLPGRGVGVTRDDIVNDALAETGDPLVGNFAGYQGDGPTTADGGFADSGEESAVSDLGKADVEEQQAFCTTAGLGGVASSAASNSRLSGIEVSGRCSAGSKALSSAMSRWSGEASRTEGWGSIKTSIASLSVCIRKFLALCRTTFRFFKEKAPLRGQRRLFRRV
jgi:hypothetical protein